MAVVADVQHGVALAGPDPELVVDLGHQRADRVDHDPTVGPGRRHHLGGRAVGREHERSSGGHVLHVVDEHDPLGPELVDHVPVVDDLVVAVDGGLEDPHHPGQGLDGLLHPGTEPPRFGQEHSVHAHRARLPGSGAPTDPACRREGWGDRVA